MPAPLRSPALRVLRWMMATLFGWMLLSGSASADTPASPEEEAVVADLLAEVGYGVPIEGAWVDARSLVHRAREAGSVAQPVPVAFTSTTRKGDGMYVAHLTAELDGKPVDVGTLSLRRHGGPMGATYDAWFHTTFGRPRVEYLESDELVFATLIRAFESVQHQTHQEQAPRSSYKPRVDYRTHLAGILAFFGVVLGALRLRRGPMPIEVFLKPNHMIPAGIQIVLLTYWGMYWDGVAMRVPMILLQLLFTFLLDATFAFAMHGRWRVNVGPLPIVFSTNLFIWFIDPVPMYGLLAIAIASKYLIQRDGRHVFNPSAFGISIFGLLSMTAPTLFPWGVPAPGHEFNLPPNMAEIIILLTLIVQYRFPIVPMSIGGFVAMTWFRFGWLAPPAPLWPTTLLVLTLFATDPMSTPRTNVGRVLYGAFVGVGIGVAAAIIRSFQPADQYAKVMAIPVGNALVPVFDAMGTRIEAWWERVTHTQILTPRWNLAHIGIWLLLVIPTLAREKADNFESFTHWQNQTPTMVFGDDGVPRCRDNPVFCSAFSFVDEVRLRLSPAERPPAGG